MKKFICSMVLAGLTLVAMGHKFAAAAEEETNAQAQVWVFSGHKQEQGRTPQSSMTLTLAQRLTISWDGMAVEPETVKDQGNGRIEWQGMLGGHWYLVRMSVSDDFQRVRLDYDVLSGRGGTFLYSGVANLTKENR